MGPTKISGCPCGYNFPSNTSGCGMPGDSLSYLSLQFTATSGPVDNQYCARPACVDTAQMKQRLEL